MLGSTWCRLALTAAVAVLGGAVTAPVEAQTLAQVKQEFGDAVSVDVLGMTDADLPDGVTRLWPSAQGGRSYPGFVHWLTRPAWRQI